jgi:predicted HD superfamily hydrolase involved in NAD metabolism
MIATDAPRTDVRSSEALPTPDQIRARLREVVSAETYGHVQRTAQIARELAAQHGVEPLRAEVAALLHDIADPLSGPELLTRADRYGIPVSLTEARVPRLLHAPVGAEILRHEWAISDEEILDAVRYHISGAPVMSPLVKVIFVADKIEPARDRHYGGLGPIRTLARTDLDAAMLRLYAWRMSTLVEAGQQVDEQLVTARNTLIEQTLAMYR